MKKFLLKLLMGASLTSSIFIFQACYGTPPVEVDIPRNVTESVVGEEEDPIGETVIIEEVEEPQEIASED